MLCIVRNTFPRERAMKITHAIALAALLLAGCSSSGDSSGDDQAGANNPDPFDPATDDLAASVWYARRNEVSETLELYFQVTADAANTGMSDMPYTLLVTNTDGSQTIYSVSGTMLALPPGEDWEPYVSLTYAQLGWDIDPSSDIMLTIDLPGADADNTNNTATRFLDELDFGLNVAVDANDFRETTNDSMPIAPTATN